MMSPHRGPLSVIYVTFSAQEHNRPGT